MYKKLNDFKKTFNKFKAVNPQTNEKKDLSEISLISMLHLQG